MNGHNTNLHPQPLRIRLMARGDEGASRRRWALLADMLTVGLALIWLLPLVFSLLMSVRPAGEPISTGSIFFGSTLTLTNYGRALAVAPWGWHYITTLIFVIGTLAVQVFTVTLAGYAFARMRFAGRQVLLILVLLQLMIPPGVLLVQNFATIRELGLYDTRWALMLPYWSSAFGTLLLRQAFREVPYELEEAARIDGAGLGRILFRIYVPLCIPSYIAFALISISSHWNELLWPLVVTRSEEVRPLTVGLNKLFNTSDTGADYSLLMAGTLLVIAPLVVLFMAFQRRFIESFASSGLK
ncbi:MAG: carbohydrate ABC transporter permease [Anaerolineae bacterium]|nr:carbohydrate ABC transporter permease [Anaerolineae bacterium]